MEDTLSCTTSGRNIYTINREKKHLFLTHPSLVPHLHPKYTGKWILLITMRGKRLI